MYFWKMAWELGWADYKQIRMITITEDNPYGYITKEEFQEITEMKWEEAPESIEMPTFDEEEETHGEENGI